MRFTKVPGRLLPILLAVLSAIVTGATPARADKGPSSVDPRVSAYLAAHPGGQVISGNDISYGGGRFIVSVVPPAGAAAGVPDCPVGWFCFYEYINFGYPRGKLSDCGWQDLAYWNWQDRTESAHYNLNTGYTVFLDHGSSPQHTDDVRLFTVSATARTIADVGVHRNKANHVYRYC
jgi:hypothetical protein